MSGIDALLREDLGTRQDQPLATTGTDPGDGFSAWVLRGPLAWSLLGLVAVQLATWVPHYLTWPFWADHDVHATLARAWDLGRLPYRDMRCNNFPGSIYLFWVLGKLAGWGRTVPFYAFDAGLLIGFGVALLAWSRSRLGAILPGLVGYLTFLTYYLGLDYSHAGQKDWHGPCFAVLGLLAAEGWPNRTGRLASASAFALALAFRPQTVFLLPALVLAIDESARGTGEPFSKTVRALLEWGVAFAVLLALLFLPLALAGVLSDFERSLHLVGYGSRYNQVTVPRAIADWFFQAVPMRLAFVPVALLILGWSSDSAQRRMALTWGMALAGVSLYKPLSPYPHSYLFIPLTLVWSISLTALASLVLNWRRPSPSLQLVAILAILSLGTTIRPTNCILGGTWRAIATLRQGGMPEAQPYGYRSGTVATAAYYPWRDYRAVLNYLRERTLPTTRVANVLKGDPAITAAVDRPSAFPAESLAWLRMVTKADTPQFAEALRECPNSVVVWSPGERGPDPNFDIQPIEQVVRAHYQPEAKFGAIEVWRRKGEAARPGLPTPSERLGARRRIREDELPHDEG